MQAIFKKILCTKIGLKGMAFIIGTSFWYWLHIDTMMNKECSVPIYFYDMHDYDIKSHCDEVEITVRGARKMLHALQDKQCAVHINAAELSEGKNEVYIFDQKIFLPDQMKLVNCNPHVIEIIKTKRCEA